MKRFVCLITVFILCFSINTNSVLANSKTDPTGYDSWSTFEKFAYWEVNVSSIIGATIGCFTSGNGGEFRQTMIDVYNDFATVDNYDTYYEYLAAHTSFDDTTKTWAFDDDALVFINAVKDEVESEITYTYGYLPGSPALDRSGFKTQNAYCIVNAFILNNPSKAFYLSGGNLSLTDSKTGNTVNGSGWTVHVLDYPYSGVCNPFPTLSSSSRAQFYTDQWLNKFTSTIFYVFDHDEGLNYMWYYDQDGNTDYLVYSPDVKDFDLSLIGETRSEEMLSYVLSSGKSWDAESPRPYIIYSDNTAGIPLFKSLADLKNGTEGGTCGQYMPGYTPGTITDNSVTQTEINDFSTNYNYYYGSGNDGDGSGDDGSGSGGSSGSSSWLDSIFSGLDSLGDAILNMFGKLSDFLGDAVSFITDGITSVLDLSQNGFVDLLTAFFPFLPKEWVTAVTLALGLSLFGLVIHMFKGG